MASGNQGSELSELRLWYLELMMAGTWDSGPTVRNSGRKLRGVVCWSLTLAQYGCIWKYHQVGGPNSCNQWGFGPLF